MTLANKSLTELRGIAISLSIPDVFQKDKAHLVQEIQSKQQRDLRNLPQKEVQQAYVIKSRGKEEKCDIAVIEDILTPLKDRGLKTNYDEERWYFRCGSRSDEGTLTMPLLTAVRCAEKLME